MFQSFVVGPVGVRGFGLARRCVECRETGGAQAAACGGFGSGCLIGRRREQEEVRHGFTYAPLLDIDPRLGGF